ncbi:MAG: hypothetical protein COS85_10740, partial [Armatimonadetes bacterium CG07_land_8_20_14_0_80_59_28]
IPRNKFGGITESIGYVRLRFSRDSIFDDLLTVTLVKRRVLVVVQRFQQVGFFGQRMGDNDES